MGNINQNENEVYLRYWKEVQNIWVQSKVNWVWEGS